MKNHLGDVIMMGTDNNEKRGLVSKNFAYTGCDNLEVMTVAKRYNRFLTNLVTKTAKNIDGKKILDFGAGSGTYADLLRQQGVSVDCLEPDVILRKSLGAKGHKVYEDVSKLSKKSYDIVYSFNVFEHIEDDFDVASLVVKSIKPGGTLIIYVPAFQMLYSSMDKKVEHVRRYRLDRLRKLASENQLLIQEAHYCDPVGFFAALSYKYLGNEDGSLSIRAIKFYDTCIFPVSQLIGFVTKKAFGKNALLIAKKI